MNAKNINKYTSQNANLFRLFRNINASYNDNETYNDNGTTPKSVRIVANVVSFPIRFAYVSVYVFFLCMVYVVSFVFDVIVNVCLQVAHTHKCIEHDGNTRTLHDHDSKTAIIDARIAEYIKQDMERATQRRNERNAKRNA